MEKAIWATLLMTVFITTFSATVNSSPSYITYLDTQLPASVKPTLEGSEPCTYQGVVPNIVQSKRTDGSKLLLNGYKYKCGGHSVGQEVKYVDAYLIESRRVSTGQGEQKCLFEVKSWHSGFLHQEQQYRINPVGDSDLCRAIRTNNHMVAIVGLARTTSKKN